MSPTSSLTRDLPSPVRKRVSITSRKDVWRRFVDAVPNSMPERLSLKQLAQLSDDGRFDYDESRHDWHANFGTIVTPQLRAVRDELDMIVDSNRQPADRVRGAAVVDGLAGLGKSTILNQFGRDFDRTHRRRFGVSTDSGDERIPVFKIGLAPKTTLPGLNRMICEFYGHPGADRGNASQLTSYALDCVLSCDTRVGIIDDIHFIDQKSNDGIAVNNHLKWLANELPITFIYAGVGLVERRFFQEGLYGQAVSLAQIPRRWTRLPVGPFDPGEDWQLLVKAIERQLVLAKARPGQLTALSDYLYSRTEGAIGSLVTLILRGCYVAIKRGEEKLSRTLLDTVRIDEASERNRERKTRKPRSQAAENKP